MDTLDFGNVEYVGPVGPGVLTLEMSYREDLILPARSLDIEAFGVPKFAIRALAIDEMIAEKWRCLVQRSPRRPGDPYDLWYLWTDSSKREPRGADDIIDGDAVKRLVPQKVTLHNPRDVLQTAVDQYKPVWPGAVGHVLPSDAPSFDEVRKAIVDASRAWTPW